MPKGKPVELTLEMTATYVCRGKKFVKKLDGHDFVFYSDPCECCGVHEEAFVQFLCPECKRLHQKELWGC